MSRVIICPECGKKKPHYAKGLCRICWAHTYYNKTVSSKQRLAYNLKHKYGITLAEYDDILEAQDGGCAICGKTPKEEGKRLAVDHNHETGQIRALLCAHCNTGLGGFRDNPQLLAKGIEYLLSWSEKL